MRRLDQASSSSASNMPGADTASSSSPPSNPGAPDTATIPTTGLPGTPQPRDRHPAQTVRRAPATANQLQLRRVQVSGSRTTAKPGRAISSPAPTRSNAAAQPIDTILAEWAQADPAHAPARQRAVAIIQGVRAGNHTRLELSQLPLGTLPDCLDRIALRTLIVADCQLQHLPALPPSLKTLNVRQNQLVELPQLPFELVKLDATANQLRQLPTLPADLAWLGMRGNRLTQLHGLPESLTHLDVSGNLLLRLPHLPASLRHLNISTNAPMDLHGLPPMLSELEICHMRLLNLPSLPTGLTKLWARINDLIQLPDLPPGLTHLNVAANRLHALPELPPMLTQLIARSNRIRQLPALPYSLVKLDVSHNALASLPASISTAPHLTHIDIYLNRIPGPALDTFVDTMNALGKNMSYINFDRAGDMMPDHGAAVPAAAMVRRMPVAPVVTCRADPALEPQAATLAAVSAVESAGTSNETTIEEAAEALAEWYIVGGQTLGEWEAVPHPNERDTDRPKLG